ncbi:MAG: nuclear transport factor 2 family protein [Deltaproteobacteria bacterium]|nr:nuclear transport factor 2 family protein [Deltaproteobacteria bacterium]
METWQLIAREGIRDTISRYTWCSEFMDSAGFADCFTADAVLEIKDGATYHGRDGVVSMITGVRDRTRELAPVTSGAPAVMRHHVSSIRIELDGRERARAFSYFAVFVPPHGHDHWGRYADELVLERDGRWRFARRRVSVDGAVAASKMFPLPKS